MPSHKSPSIVFLTPYPYNTAPGPRFRFEQYYPALKSSQFRFDIFPFFSVSGYRRVREGPWWVRPGIIAKGIFLRFLTLFRIVRFEFVFIFREVCPLGPPLFEWIIAKLLRKKIIYDFDDAIWLTDNKNESMLETTLRWRGKVKWICRWSHRISCGNRYLADYAARHAHSVVINPTTIDTNTQHSLRQSENSTPAKKLTIGWTGTQSTLKYVDPFIEVMEQLQEKYANIRFLVIADQDPNFSLKSFVFKKWSLDTEIADLREIDIGIMPLPDDEWTRGKCGFKILQYLALGIPAVASPVGINKEIINSSNGFLAGTSEEWQQSLETLIENPDLRHQMGQQGRMLVVERYSVDSNLENFLALFS